MSWLTFLIPNFNLQALGTLIIPLIIGIIVIILSGKIPIKKFANKGKTLGYIIIIVGLFGWLGVSFMQDIFQSPKILWTIIAMIVLVVIGVVIFMPRSKRRKK